MSPSSPDHPSASAPSDPVSAGPASGDPDVLPDQAARDYAVDPRHNVVLEASAGTGKTSVLVRRYLALLDVGVEPANILAITFTRKAAAEMRERIIGELRRRGTQSVDAHRRWRQLRDRLGDIAISTIDAFCLALLREFPLEADLDPGFGIADETDVARLLDGALDVSIRAARSRLSDDAATRLLLTQVPQRRLVRSLARLVDRRVTATHVFDAFVARAPTALAVDQAVMAAAARVADALVHAPGGLLALVNDRPVPSARYDLLRSDIEILVRGEAPATLVRAALAHVRPYFLAQDGRPRRRPYGVRKEEFPSPAAWDRHVRALDATAPVVADALSALGRDTKAVLVRGLQRVHVTTVEIYRRALHTHDVLDFTESLVRTVALLAAMDEFAQSRFRLQSRYHHVLVDELQDTSRLQWRLIGLLIEAWGEGSGVAHDGPVPPTIFVVGDRKQSIYRFRDADVSILHDAAGLVGSLRPGDRPHRSISASFRARPELQAFVNDLCALMVSSATRGDRFRYDDSDRFPVEHGGRRASADGPALGLALSSSERDAALAIANEIDHLLKQATVRDRDTGVARAARPGDIAVLFRVRESHRHYERALEALGIRTYVYKGLGFFQTDEIQDLLALIRFLARPASTLRVAALLRSRLVRLSDPALRLLAPDLVDAVTDRAARPTRETLGLRDRRVLELLRAAVPGWLARVDRVPPHELLDDILRDTAYYDELVGSAEHQARENVKKFRGLIRRLHSRGYLTMSRLAEHLARLSMGDESNAVVDAADAVNLMTIHAAKGLEFPVVFIVDLGRGAGRAESIRLVPDADGGPSVDVTGFDPAGDERQRAAEKEEVKRLLYVALTRARDRLYLSATVTGGRPNVSRGSLGEVLPQEFTAFLVNAARQPRDGGPVPWTAPGRPSHYFSWCLDPIERATLPGT